MRQIAQFAFLTLVLAGCNQAPVGYEYDGHSSVVVVNYIDDCWDAHTLDGLGCQVSLLECELDSGVPHDASCIADIFGPCTQRRQQVFDTCLENIPTDNLECLEVYDPQSYTQDSDGDGLADRIEINLELDPCSPCTYPWAHCDGEMDSDLDGIPNAIDETPGCGQHCYQ